MATYFISGTPNELLKTFKKAIDDGHVTTWSYDSDGDFTHTATQWKNLAWFRPSVEQDKRLVLNIMPPQNAKVSSEVYAIYHGRIIESMLAHCDKLFTSGFASALPDAGDSIE